MKPTLKTSSLALCFGLLLGSFSAAEPASPAWTNLKLADFHSTGRTDLQPDSWIEKDGIISWVKNGAHDLLSQKSYGDFELELEWNIVEGGNSGIFFRGDSTSNPYYKTAIEMQVLDNVKAADSKQANHIAGSLYDLIAAPATAAKPAGEWNKARIRCKGKHVETWLNDVKTSDVEIGSEAWIEVLNKSKFKTWAGFGTSATGPIGLQDHNNGVSFRSIRIREL